MMSSRKDNETLSRASQEDALWLMDMLNREGRRFATRVALEEDATLVLQW